MIRVPFLIGFVAKRPSPVRERPMRYGLVGAIVGMSKKRLAKAEQPTRAFQNYPRQCRFGSSTDTSPTSPPRIVTHGGQENAFAMRDHASVGSPFYRHLSSKQSKSPLKRPWVQDAGPRASEKIGAIRTCLFSWNVGAALALTQRRSKVAENEGFKIIL